MGGIHAGKGFDFQARYAACHVPDWLLQEGFNQLFYEGTGDIDLRYKKAGQSFRIHIQVKDHDVSPSELKNVIAVFRQIDTGMPGVYKNFTLVCPALSAKLQPIEFGLARLRSAKPFYDDAGAALAPTKDDLDERLQKIRLDDAGIAFVHSKVFFEIGYGDLHHDHRAIDLFVARLLDHPEYAGKTRATVQPAYAEVLRAIDGRKGAILERHDVEQILRSAVAAVNTGEQSVTVWVQNWTKETFDVPADYVVDWSQHFDRDSRRVPSEEVWNTELLQELRSLRAKIVAERKERVIHFRGKCTLSTGVALGATFPSVGGWTFEIPQPPSKEPWRSDSKATSPYDLHVEVTEGGGSGADIVLCLNIRGDGRDDVVRYIECTKNPPRLCAFIAPTSPGRQSITGSEDACAFAQAVRERLGQIIKDSNLTQTRLFYYGPFALSVFLGQQLTSVGEIQLFEYQDPGYVPSCKLKT
jgi:hypothetical protein